MAVAPKSGEMLRLELAGKPVSIKVRRYADARRLRLICKLGEGVIQLSAPLWTSRHELVAFAAHHAHWLIAQQARIPAAVPFRPGAQMPFCGVLHELVRNPGETRSVRRDAASCRIFASGHADLFAARMSAWLKRQARARLVTKVEGLLAQREAPPPVTVRLSDASSCWGRCSRGPAGRIRIALSWRLIFAPETVQDYVVAHEVAHIAHMNHAPAFWSEVRRLLGRDPAPDRRWLKREGSLLHRYGRSG